MSGHCGDHTCTDDHAGGRGFIRAWFYRRRVRRIKAALAARRR